MMKRIGIAASCLLAVGCSIFDPPEVACTMEARSSFAFTVVDSIAGASLAPRATVAVSDGTFADTLMAPPTPNDPYSGGVYERPGVYAVTVTHDGYRDWRMSGVRVDNDECHVITRSLTARLAPA